MSSLSTQVTPATPIIWNKPLPLPPSIDGSRGRLRGDAALNMSGANTDCEYIRMWLANTRSENTRETYAREVTRFSLWAWGVRKKAVSDMTREDIAAFEAFLNDLPDDWVGYGKRKGDDGWRPFRKRPTPKTIAHCLYVIQALYSAMEQDGYILRSPMKGHRILKTTDRTGHVGKGLSKEAVEIILEAIDQMPEKGTRDRFKKARARWLVVLLLNTGARVSEAASMRHKDIVRIGNHERSGGGWAIRITGKGNKTRLVPLPENVVHEWARFQQECGLDTAPKDELSEFPLIPSISGEPVTRQHIALILKDVFRDARIYAGNKGLSPLIIEELEKSNPHRMRHTCLTWLANELPLSTVQKFAGHESPATTSNYIAEDFDAIAKVQSSWKL